MNCAGNQCPASGAFGNAFVSAPFNAGALNVGSHMQSKPLPSLLSTCWLAPSDSPGGLTHTNASMCAKPVGVAAGRSPIPAPFWLHHAPRCRRRSTREALINVLRSVEVLAAVGRTPARRRIRRRHRAVRRHGAAPAVARGVHQHPQRGGEPPMAPPGTTTPRSLPLPPQLALSIASSRAGLGAIPPNPWSPARVPPSPARLVPLGPGLGPSLCRSAPSFSPSCPAGAGL